MISPVKDRHATAKIQQAGKVVLFHVGATREKSSLMWLDTAHLIHGEQSLIPFSGLDPPHLLSSWSDGVREIPAAKSMA